MLPDAVVLYLTASQFPGGELPPEIVALKAENPIFEVRFWNENIRSYTKLIPALHDFPDDVIITVDDDVRYHPHMLRDLVRLHERYPELILAHRARRVRPARPYSKWWKYKWYHSLFNSLYFDFATMQTGVGGVLYPPRSLDPEMLDPQVFMSIAPTVDDVWFWAAATSQGTKVLPVPFGRIKLHKLEKPGAIALCTVNTGSGVDVNRNVAAEILKRFPNVKQRLEGSTGPGPVVTK
jgi:hypothetical protein